jgi:hypothetical protein
MLIKHSHIINPTHTLTHTLQNKFKQPQYQIHTNRNSHNTITYPQYKVTLMYTVLLPPRTSPNEMMKKRSTEQRRNVTEGEN